VPLFESHVRITYLENEYGILSISSNPSSRFLSIADGMPDGMLFFMKSLCVAIIPKEVYLFDSHGRNNNGYSL